MSVYNLKAQSDFVALIARARRGMVRITNRLAGGEINTEEWGRLFHLLIQGGHAEGWYLGRLLGGGDLSPFGNDDQLMGVAKADEEADFLRRFMAAIEGGDSRYWDDTGNLRVPSVLARMNLYVGKMRGTANEALVETADQEWYWRLGAPEEHCDDCPQIAALSPFTRDANVGYPGSGDTACLGNCQCYVQLANGVRGFMPA
jgi:hypothetical protein